MGDECISLALPDLAGWHSWQPHDSSSRRKGTPGASHAGLMLRFVRNRFCGSHCALTSASR